MSLESEHILAPDPTDLSRVIVIIVVGRHVLQRSLRLRLCFWGREIDTSSYGYVYLQDDLNRTGQRTYTVYVHGLRERSGDNAKY